MLLYGAYKFSMLSHNDPSTFVITPKHFSSFCISVSVCIKSTFRDFRNFQRKITVQFSRHYIGWC